MNAQTEFNGDQCMVLPARYLQSAEAVSEIYADELGQSVGSLEVGGLAETPGFFQGTFLAALLWAAPSAWMVCF